MEKLEQPTSIYEKQRLQDCASYQAFYKGSVDGLFVVIATEELSETARGALVATAARGGFSADAITWITAIVGSESLAPKGLLQLVESFDPLCLVVVDRAAAEVLAHAYNQPIKLETLDFILGRPACCFVNFESMLKNDAKKQTAWALLKDMLSRARIA